MRAFALGLAAMLAATGAARADQEITWKQTINVPKGQNMPRERADILGIELGDTYAEAKAKLEKLAADSIQPQPLTEHQRVIRFKPAGVSSFVTVSYIAQIQAQRQIKGTDRPNSESFTLVLSAPSSGHQVVSISRSIYYNTESDQPRVSELLAQLQAKMKADPQIFLQSDRVTYLFQYNDGQPFTPKHSSLDTCFWQQMVDDARAVPNINKSGECDAGLRVTVQFGISRDHAKYINFALHDNERVKANIGADFAYMDDYVRSVQESTRGVQPKL
jgi:hypothetical protein